jgi:hypothetical protein
MKAIVQGVILAGAILSRAHAATLTLVERATTDAISVHAGKAADNTGDILTFNNDIYDADNMMKMGTDQGYCVRIVPGHAYECHWTLFMAHGQIVVEGPFYNSEDSTLAVIGGTGDYATARGEMTLHARDSRGSAYDFIYSLK